MSILLVLIVNEMILKDIVMSNGYVHYLPWITDERTYTDDFVVVKM